MYIGLPVVALVWAIWPGPHRGVRCFRLAAMAMLGLSLSAGLSWVYAFVGDGTVRPGQVLLGAYFAVALMLVLRGLDRGVLLGMALLLHPWLRRRSASEGPGGRSGGGPGPAGLVGMRAATLLVRGAILLTVGLPWVMAAVMVYRVKVTPALTPEALGEPFGRAEAVEFEATDGTPIAGWFIAPLTPDLPVVVVAHGLGANSGNQLLVARRMVDAGLGVLAIDLRAHGRSAGQLASFGIRERHDVLGAVRWLRMRADVAGPVGVVGISQGGAAALAAAATDSAEGRAIAAVAVVSTYGDLGRLMQELSYRQFPGPLGWLVRQVGFPLAELHSGVPLRRFRPADAADRLWPRPLLVVHGTADELIPASEGRRLFRDATLPKQALWLANANHTSVVFDEAVAAELARFFADPRPEPVVRR